MGRISGTGPAVLLLGLVFAKKIQILERCFRVSSTLWRMDVGETRGSMCHRACGDVTPERRWNWVIRDGVTYEQNSRPATCDDLGGGTRTSQHRRRR